MERMASETHAMEAIPQKVQIGKFDFSSPIVKTKYRNVVGIDFW
jgi:hypothetical protein